MVAKSISHHLRSHSRRTLLVGIYRGILNPGILRRENDFVHSVQPLGLQRCLKMPLTQAFEGLGSSRSPTATHQPQVSCQHKTCRPLLTGSQCRQAIGIELPLGVSRIFGVQTTSKIMGSYNLVAPSYPLRLLAFSV